MGYLDFGRTNRLQRAHTKLTGILENHQPLAIDAAIETHIEKVVGDFSAMRLAN